MWPRSGPQPRVGTREVHLRSSRQNSDEGRGKGGYRHSCREGQGYRNLPTGPPLGPLTQQVGVHLHAHTHTSGRASPSVLRRVEAGDSRPRALVEGDLEKSGV